MLDRSDKQFIHDSIETTVAQLSGAMIKALENVATKEDLAYCPRPSLNSSSTLDAKHYLSEHPRGVVLPSTPGF